MCCRVNSKAKIRHGIVATLLRRQIFLETMIVATIVIIVATIKKIAKLAILKAKFKEINHII